MVIIFFLQYCKARLVFLTKFKFFFYSAPSAVATSQPPNVKLKPDIPPAPPAKKIEISQPPPLAQVSQQPQVAVHPPQAIVQHPQLPPHHHVHQQMLAQVNYLIILNLYF